MNHIETPKNLGLRKNVDVIEDFVALEGKKRH